MWAEEKAAAHSPTTARWSSNFLLAYHQHRAVGVAKHRIGDAAHQRPPQGPKAPASQHDKSRVELISQSHNLCIGPAYPRVHLRYLAAALPFPLHQLIELCSSLLLGVIVHSSPEIRVQGCSARGLVGYEGQVPHIDDVQLGVCFLGQVGGRGEGQLGLFRAVGGQEDLGRKDAHRVWLPSFDALTALKPYDASRRALALPSDFHLSVWKANSLTLAPGREWWHHARRWQS